MLAYERFSNQMFCVVQENLGLLASAFYGYWSLNCMLMGSDKYTYINSNNTHGSSNKKVSFFSAFTQNAMPDSRCVRTQPLLLLYHGVIDKAAPNFLFYFPRCCSTGMCVGCCEFIYGWAQVNPKAHHSFHFMHSHHCMHNKLCVFHSCVFHLFVRFPSFSFSIYLFLMCTTA